MFTKEVYDKISYIRATLRNRLDYVNEKAIYPVLKNLLDEINPKEWLSFLDEKVIPMTKVVGSWTQWVDALSFADKVKNDGSGRFRVIFDSEDEVLRYSDSFVKERVPAVFEICSYCMTFLGYNSGVSCRFHRRVLNGLVIVLSYLDSILSKTKGIWSKECDNLIEWGKCHLVVEWEVFNCEYSEKCSPIPHYIESLPLMSELVGFHHLRNLIDFVAYCLNIILPELRIMWIENVLSGLCSEYGDFELFGEMKERWEKDFPLEDIL